MIVSLLAFSPAYNQNTIMRSMLPIILASVFFISTGTLCAQKKLVIIGSSTSACFSDPAYYTLLYQDCYVGKLESFYNQEHQLALLYKIFAGIAVLISCLGLYGLVSFMAVQRRKEVGIRKVLGASIPQIIFLFSKEFTLLILIAFAIATPVAWYMMSNWLQHFVYRIPMRPFIFILAVGISLGIAWITVGYKSFRAALINPARSLKSE